MKFISLFSGIDAASVAWLRLGWRCLAFSEIDKSACAVLKHHYPDVPNLGDVKRITEAQITSLDSADLVIFGFPCQDLSVAGKRAGLKGERSGLFFDAMRVVRWSGARWAIAENVPGLFSSNDGLDFAAVVGEMAGIRVDVPDGGWANAGIFAGPDALVEWATLDAQYFGVPQRRRRIFLIRDTGDWRSRAPLFLVPHSMSGHPPPRREAGQGTTHDLALSLTGSGSGSGSGRGVERSGESRGQDPVVAVTLTSGGTGMRGHQDPVNTTLIPVCMSTGQGSAEIGIGIGIGTTLNCNHEAPIVTHALRADGFDASEDGTGRGTPIIAFNNTGAGW